MAEKNSEPLLQEVIDHPEHLTATGGMEMRTADPNFIVPRMRPDEVEMIRTWETAEGWNPGLHHGPCFFATDPRGFFVGELDGRPVSRTRAGSPSTSSTSSASRRGSPDARKNRLTVRKSLQETAERTGYDSS